MDSSVFSTSDPIPAGMFQQIASTSVLDEVANIPGAVRWYIYHRGNHSQDDPASRRSLLFFVYQTERYGPQNGFRLCIVHRDYRVASDVKTSGHGEDDVDRIEAPIPQGHMEVVILGHGNDIPQS